MSFILGRKVISTDGRRKCVSRRFLRDPHMSGTQNSELAFATSEWIFLLYQSLRTGEALSWKYLLIPTCVYRYVPRIPPAISFWVQDIQPAEGFGLFHVGMPYGMWSSSPHTWIQQLLLSLKQIQVFLAGWRLPDSHRR